MLLAACGRSSTTTPAARAVVARPPATSSLLRFAHDGGIARLYDAADLATHGWHSAERIPALRRVVGADLDQRLVYAIDAQSALVSLDLTSRRVRSLLKGVSAAALGPNGALYAVDSVNGVTQVARRTAIRFRSPLSGPPRSLFGTMTGTLVALPARGAGLQVVSSDRAAPAVALAAGPAAATFFGDLVAVAADSAVLLWDPGAKKAPRRVRTPGHARAVLFSPSGHRLFVAQDADRLLVIDRFSGDRIDEIDLPGPAAGLRTDLYGGWLLVRPRDGDSTWVVDVARNRYVGAVAARWGPDLPVAAGPGTLVARRGDDVVALDLTRAGFPSIGHIAGGAADLWLAVAWSPVDAPEETPADSAAAPTDRAPGGTSRIYLQVSSSRNPAWARDLADKILGAGLPASMLAPALGEELYRVVLGPYPSREAAEEATRKVGMPSFVVTVQDSIGR